MYRDVITQNCIQACIDCELECEQCSSACLMDDAYEMAHCLQLLRDCANICALTAKFLAHNSDYAPAICETCVEICLACRDECARHENEHSRRCTEACHRAAEECEKFALLTIH